MFQTTLLDLVAHSVKIGPFIDIMTCLRLNFLDINDIYFFMIISAHDEISKQHFFNFELASIELNACYLKEYTSKAGLSALNKVISMNSYLNKYTFELLPENEVNKLTVKQKKILKTIGGIYKSNSFYKYQLSKELYDKLFLFLNYAEKIHPYVCRAPFLPNSISY
jgi:hypothetical protein